LLRITARLDKLLSNPKLDTIGADLSATVSEAKDTVTKVNQEVTRIYKGKSLTRTIEKASELMEGGLETARSADRLIRRTDNNINRLSQKLDRSADNLLDLTTKWKKKPFSTFFFGAEEEKQKKP
ncbi:MAG: hypothetical protein FJY85_12360, partial [Deltaproteobacteria bacterium]|nr:hypothetical protein [Deltaproteobacteria bacterium]